MKVDAHCSSVSHFKTCLIYFYIYINNGKLYQIVENCELQFLYFLQFVQIEII